MEGPIESILLLVILVLLLGAFLFFSLTLFKKLSRIGRDKKQQAYQDSIENFLFGYVFGNSTAKEYHEDPVILRFKNSSSFQKVAIKSILSLHDNYSGDYSKKLEMFYAESGLVDHSLKNLNSKKWPQVVEAIRDLSSLKYLPAYTRFVSLQNHKNQFIQKEVLLGIIKLKGIAELFKFNSSTLYLNDWVQSNILFAVKKHRIEPPQNLPELLQHLNPSFVILGVRLIDYYKIPVHYEILSQFYRASRDEKIKKEIIPILRKTEQLR